MNERNDTNNTIARNRKALWEHVEKMVDSGLLSTSGATHNWKHLKHLAECLDEADHRTYGLCDIPKEAMEHCHPQEVMSSTIQMIDMAIISLRNVRATMYGGLDRLAAEELRLLKEQQ